MLDEIKNVWETTEAKISEREDIAIESTRPEAQRNGDWKRLLATESSWLQFRLRPAGEAATAQ